MRCVYIFSDPSFKLDIVPGFGHVNSCIASFRLIRVTGLVRIYRKRLSLRSIILHLVRLEPVSGAPYFERWMVVEKGSKGTKGQQVIIRGSKLFQAPGRGLGKWAK